MLICLDGPLKAEGHSLHINLVYSLSIVRITEKVYQTIGKKPTTLLICSLEYHGFVLFRENEKIGSEVKWTLTGLY
jgi:hypothetical protein